MKTAILAGAFALVTAAATAAPESYALDPGHSQIVLSYTHLGFSTTQAMISGFDGALVLDREDPAASSVSVSFPVKSLITGWPARFDHFMTADFFGADENPTVSFASTAITVTGEKTATITGDLTLNGMTRPVVLDAVLNQAGPHPTEGKDWAGFSATATILRSDFDMGLYAPYVSDEVALEISVEAMKVE